jgi:hypothetical protein
MEFREFRLFPLEGRMVDVEEQATIGRVLENARVIEQLPRGREVLVEVGRQIAAGLAPVAAHGEWREGYFEKVDTPASLPRQPLDARSPPGLVHVTVSVIEKYTPGMGSHFGFEGYFLSLLISPGRKEIWDARGQKAV